MISPKRSLVENPNIMTTSISLEIRFSEAYGVDDPSNENFVDIPVIAGHELTGMYGLETRTLTAAINASILLEWINTASPKVHFLNLSPSNQNMLAKVILCGLLP